MRASMSAFLCKGHLDVLFSTDVNFGDTWERSSPREIHLSLRVQSSLIQSPKEIQ